mmetsp:Transcript_10774/g.23776  ORF Transcript_10774/g.23776 Transcript_10774/m.23776 type:complete len:213 (+) Transcript_10774:48-686(+)
MLSKRASEDISESLMEVQGPSMTRSGVFVMTKRRPRSSGDVGVWGNSKVSTNLVRFAKLFLYASSVAERNLGLRRSAKGVARPAKRRLKLSATLAAPSVTSSACSITSTSCVPVGGKAGASFFTAVSRRDAAVSAWTPQKALAAMPKPLSSATTDIHSSNCAAPSTWAGSNKSCGFIWNFSKRFSKGRSRLFRAWSFSTTTMRRKPSSTGHN